MASPPQERDSISRPVMIGIAVVVLAAVAAAFFLRANPKPQRPPDPYGANLKLSDLKLGEAQNFVGAKLTYITGMVANNGGQPVTGVTVHVVFRDSIGQVAQAEDVPLYILETSGPYPDAVKLSSSPLAPRQSKQFRLTFEHVSDEWNRAYPELKVTEVALK
jgi:hypothetical protein